MKGAQMVGLEINATKVRDMVISRKKDSGRDTKKYICLFHFISNGLHIMLCAVSTGSIHLIYSICNFRESKLKVNFIIILILFR